MKYKFYLFLLISPLIISFGSSNSSTLKQISVPPSDTVLSSFNLVNKWYINAPAFFYLNTESYTINSKKFGFGHFVEFKKDGTFKAYYHASCGNDCFAASKGTYTIKNNILEIFVISAKQTGFCLDPISYENKKIGSFKIIRKTNDIFLLKKI